MTREELAKERELVVERSVLLQTLDRHNLVETRDTLRRLHQISYQILKLRTGGVYQAPRESWWTVRQQRSR